MAGRPGTSRVSIMWIVTAALMLPVLYVLSAGPLVKLFETGWLNSLDGPMLKTVMTVYFAPLQWCYNNIPAMEQFFEWYLPLWVE